MDDESGSNGPNGMRLINPTRPVNLHWNLPILFLGRLRAGGLRYVNVSITAVK
jgi:hypothetical protein